MKIGCITSDGKSVEQVDLSVVKETVYELEIVVVNHPRHYPKYKVSPQTIAFADTQKEAEELIQDALESKKWKTEDIFCFYIYERPIDYEYGWSECMSSWAYSNEGHLLDKRLFPTFWSEGKFDGRSEEEVRFKWGDLVECLWGTSVELVYVLASPPGKEHYIRISNEQGKPYFGDDSDDSYVVIDGPGYQYHSHVDALSLFTPHYNIPKSIQQKYLKIWEGYLKDLEEYRKDIGYNAPF